MSITISVIIPNWNGKHHLAQCLPTLAQQSTQEILVVDNGSTDGSAEFLREAFPNVRVIALSENIGFSAAVNAGIKQARGEFIALLNNDTEADAHWLESLQSAAMQNPTIDCFASRILCLPDRNIIDSTGDGYSRRGTAWNIGKGMPDAPFFDQPRIVFGASGAAAFYRRRFFDEVGLFDEDLFAFYEDVDLALRAQLLGKQCLYVPAAIVYHKGGGTVAHHSPVNLFYCSRNALLVLAKGMPAALLLKNAPMIVLTYARHFLRHLFRRDHRLSVLKGYASALRHMPKTLSKRPAIQRSRRISVRVLEATLQHQEQLLKMLRTLPIPPSPCDPTTQRVSPLLSIILVHYKTEDLLHRCLDALNSGNSGDTSLDPNSKNIISPDNSHSEISGTPSLSRSPDTLNSSSGNSGPVMCPPNYEIIVVDNGSDAKKIAALQRTFPGSSQPHIYWLANAKNEGFARACNQGLVRARGKYCLLLNPDCIVSPAAMQRMVERMEEHPDIGLCGGPHYFPDGRPQPSTRNFPTLWNTFTDQLFGMGYKSSHRNMAAAGGAEHVPQLMGSCLMVRHKLFEQLGLLDERFFLYFEEVDLCWRAKLAGWRIAYFADPAMAVTHTGGASSSQIPSRRHWHRYRSLCRWFAKNRPWPEAAAVQTIGLIGLSLRMLPVLAGRLYALCSSISAPSSRARAGR